MTAYDILEKFGEYANYDPDQTSFNLLSSNYEYHKACKHITSICNVWDHTGRMAVLYARCVYDNEISDARVKLHDLLIHPEAFKHEQEMYRMFHGEEVEQIENDYIEALNSAMLAMTGRKIIGERDKEKEKQIMYDSIKAVVEQLGSCHEDIYVTSGTPVGEIKNISTKIHLFNYMAECVLTLQNSAPDGAYFCYINNNGTADGYFAIMVKSNGNLFSINDRVGEAYIGQHTNSRNGRWAEEHKGIFPYEQIMTFGDHDYLGYAHTYSVDESKLSLRDMDAKHYIPVLLAIICVINGRNGKTLNEDRVVYLNSMIRGNLESGENENALIALDKTGLIARTTQMLQISFEREKFLHGGYRREFTPNGGTKNQEYVDMYAQDFELKRKPLTMIATNVLESNHEKTTNGIIADATNENRKVHAEFIGSIEQMRKQAYYEARIDLAEHIRINMKKELEAFGGIEAVKKWLDDSLRENIKTIYPILARLYQDWQNEPDGIRKHYHREDDPAWVQEIRIMDDKKPYIRYCLHYNGEKWKKNNWGEDLCPEYYYCPITGNRATIWFEFRIISADDIQHLIGNKELIRPLRNWHSKRYYRAGADSFYGGNPILDAVDAVDFVEPLDGKDVNFNYYIGFSQRGIRKLMKETANIAKGGNKS